MKFQCKNPIEVSKEMFWLAWVACRGPEGMGVYQDCPTDGRNDVWSVVSGQRLADYLMPRGKVQSPYGDYVFGRMMKLGMSIGEDFISVPDEAPREDYQAWCCKYPTYSSLFEAATTSLGEK